MPAEETTEPVLLVDVSHGGYDAEPGAGVFGELGVGGLEEDFDAVEGADDRFGLWWDSQRSSWDARVVGVAIHTAHPAKPPASPERRA